MREVKSNGAASHGALLARPTARRRSRRAYSRRSRDRDLSSSADGTTFNILRGIEWATRQGARVTNMSFAGPRNPSLERAPKAAHRLGPKPAVANQNVSTIRLMRFPSLV